MASSDKDTGRWDDDAVAAAALYDFVRFTLTDIQGISRSRLIPRRHVADQLHTGIAMCAGMNACRLHACLSTGAAASLNDVA